MTATIQEIAEHYVNLARSGGAMTAEEAFGMQLALPEGSPDIAYEEVYSTAISTMAEMICVITKKRQVDSPELDRLLTSEAMEAFDLRWNDLSARLSAGGEA